MTETTDCPYCGEEILATAKKCKHCGEFLDKDLEPKKKKGCLYWLLTILVGIIVLIIALFIIGGLVDYNLRTKAVQQAQELEQLTDEEKFALDLENNRIKFCDKTNKSLERNRLGMELECNTGDTVTVKSDLFEREDAIEAIYDEFNSNMKILQYKKIIFKDQYDKVVAERDL